MLDLVLANINCKVENTSGVLIPEDSHHPALLILIKVQEKSNINKDLVNFTYYNYRKANLVVLYQNLASVDWSSLIDITDVNFAFECFYHILYNVIDRVVLKIIVKGKRYPPWYDSNVIKSVKFKYKPWCDYKKNKDLLALHEFELLRTAKKLILILLIKVIAP